MQEAFIALGANIGDRETSLQEAIRRLTDDPEITVHSLSSVYETAPVGYTQQPSFLNMVVHLATELEPLMLLRRLLEIEQEMGRVRDVRWGPRNIDLDLLVFGEVAMDTSELTIPHPRMGERAFVLVPLRELWPEETTFPWEVEWSGFNLQEEGITRWAQWKGLELWKEL